MVSNELGRAGEILLVEAAPTDARLTTVALKQGPVRSNIHHVSNGEDALRFLRREGDYANAPRPNLVLLDLKLPRMDGHAVLRAIRSDPHLKSLVVIVLTTSENESDVLQAYGLNSNAYINKPVDVHQFMRVIQDIQRFYFEVATLPAGP